MQVVNAHTHDRQARHYIRMGNNMYMMTWILEFPGHHQPTYWPSLPNSATQKLNLCLTHWSIDKITAVLKTPLRFNSCSNIMTMIFFILTKISHWYVSEIKSVLVLIMVLCRFNNKPYPEPIFFIPYSITRPPLVDTISSSSLTKAICQAVWPL